MLSWLKGLFVKQDLKSRLRETKKVNIDGVIFIIRKINPIDFLDGSKVMLATYDTYKAKPDKRGMAEKSHKKIVEHYRDVIMAGTIKPQLSRKDNVPDSIYVDELFNDFAMADNLYSEIMAFTYGKKKIQKALQSLNL